MTDSLTDTQVKLIEAAVRSFVRYGVRKTTLSDIAGEAGVSRQTLYASFKDKDEILAAAIHFVTQQMIATTLEKCDGIEDLGSLIDIYFDENVICSYEMIASSPDAEDLISGYNEAGKKAIDETRAIKSDLMAGFLKPYEGALAASGQTRADVANLIVTASMMFKYAANNVDELKHLLTTLKLSVLALAGQR